MNASLLKLGIVAPIVSGLHGGGNLSHDRSIVLRLLATRGPAAVWKLLLQQRRAVRNFAAVFGRAALLLTERYGNCAATQVHRARSNWGHLRSLGKVGQSLLLLGTSATERRW